MNEVESARRLALRAIAEAYVDVRTQERADLWPSVQGLRQRFVRAPYAAATFETLRAEALTLLGRLKN
ncbi:hypothetical protein [Deinococcus peraridilitoris]|uniref:Uncharacterized protein n=1 Tax=Deinococcus peraridilitoris (strain DSM 19664 / LMG 22246 / CIP 109416 / KR-200) TaxID=937777 RepID=L0A5B9_DEIPD|nr:hypothetical protein [Deinococcus peraridilitoris]AFZ68614.1 hypothetical protein Deipe_3171 [Deinococcus peraridilitoris DSM 19664]